MCKKCEENEKKTDEKFTSCCECGAETEQNDAICSNNGDHYCSDCYGEKFTSCCDCNGETEWNDTVCSNNGHHYCSDCYNEVYRRCDSCDEEMHVDHAYYDDDGTFCESCHDDNNSEDSSDLINSYNYKPLPEFSGESSRIMPYIGFELEIECSENEKSSSAEIAIKLPNVYLKDDSSIDYGFEIVSHPSTLTWHSEKNYKKVFDALRENGCRGHDTKTCGLHFHISNEFLNGAEIDNIIYFFSSHQEKIEKISRRSNEQWANFKKVEKHKKRNCRLEGDTRRYQAINTNNAATIEFRSFKSTLKYSTFIASMEFVFGVYRYCKKRGITEEKIESWSEFIGYCHRLKLRNFLNYINERNIQ